MRTDSGSDSKLESSELTSLSGSQALDSSVENRFATFVRIFFSISVNLVFSSSTALVPPRILSTKQVRAWYQNQP